ncbi:NfeD family protein [Shouchella lehensis]|uniref:Nodulation efficiency NfeD domain-containing protein n=1 Tax=Shouchella lehensis G1 TaxID=1246626 RepID=A0A060LUY0_9BACI|nr:nodulation protein NfeD [Shouchella lehensis]AIC94057.1 nodulation efficiency NfeD domain-containing protein [Shouchella lehensis G1]
MNKWLKVAFVSYLLVFLLLPLQMIVKADDTNDARVYVIPVEQTVERGLEAFLERSFKEAAEENADHIILDIHTPGGAVDAAGNIANIMNNTAIPVTAFINSEAISAGAYIALNADQIVMVPNGQMGSAGVIDGSGNAAEEKVQSLWISRMKTAAEENGPDGGRDPAYAEAMSNADFDVEGFPSGYLTLNAEQALEVGYADAIERNVDGVINFLGYQSDEVNIVHSEVSIAEQIARFVTNPIVIPILLSIGSLGLIMELYSPGFGVPGFMGISALLLFFFGHMVAGFAGWESLILVVVGIVLLGVEMVAPGFGIFGILGIGLIIGGLFMASFSTTVMVISVAITLVVTIAAAIILFVFFGNRGPWKKLVLQAQTTSEEGYLSTETDQGLIGQTGKALSDLRPAGIALINDRRLDVVSEGSYIGRGSMLKVVYTSGSRVVVREIEQND